MKWTRTSKDLHKKAEDSRDTTSRLCRIRRGWYISALLNCAMQRRKLEEHCTDRLVPCGSGWSGLESNQPRRICSNAITRKELKAIQRQLAVLSDEDGDRPIHVAVANEDLKLVQKLCQLMVKNSLHLDITNYMRQTPLHLAVMLGNAEITQLLLSLGASPGLSDRNGNSVLHLAVKSGNLSILHILLHNGLVKETLNLMDYEGYSALHYAVLKNNPSAVKMLHDCGSDMDKIDGKSGRTPLIHAVLEQNVSIVELLLDCGACPQKADYSGRCSLEMALQIGNRQIIQILEKSIPHKNCALPVEGFQESSKEQAVKRTKVHN